MTLESALCKQLPAVSQLHASCNLQAWSLNRYKRQSWVPHKHSRHAGVQTLQTATITSTEGMVQGCGSLLILEDCGPPRGLASVKRGQLLVRVLLLDLVADPLVAEPLMA